MTNHMPWDEGAIADALDYVLGFHVENKTTKTLCNKRVSLAHANHKADITCPVCAAELNRSDAYDNIIDPILAKLDAEEFDA